MQKSFLWLNNSPSVTPQVAAALSAQEMLITVCRLQKVEHVARNTSKLQMKVSRAVSSEANGKLPPCE